MRLSLAILLAAASLLAACDSIEALFSDNADEPTVQTERPDEIDFVVDGEGVYYATRGVDGKIHNTQKIERIPIAERATTFIYVDGRTPNLRGEEVRYVANLVEATAGDQRSAKLRRPDFVEASELAGLDGARSALAVHRNVAVLADPDAEVVMAKAIRRKGASNRARSRGKETAPRSERQGIKIESVGGEGATNSLGFGNSETVGWKSITVYYADWCGVCKRAMRWMDRNDVNYRAVDVEASDRNRREMVDFCRKKNRAADSLPTIRIGDDIMKGWDPSRFQQMAKL